MVSESHDEGQVAQDLEASALDGRGSQAPSLLAPQAGDRVVGVGELSQARSKGRVVQ